MKNKKDLKTRKEFISGSFEDNNQDNVFNNFDDIDSLGDKIFSESSPNDNPKELFNEKLVKARTRLTTRQINNITRAYHMTEIYNLKDLMKMLDIHLTLKISEKGKSRDEFVKSLQAKIENETNRFQQQPINQQFRK